MRLSIKGLAFALSIGWALAVFASGAVHLGFPNYGVAFLQVTSSIYPGFHGGTSFGDVVVGTLYALVDGAVCGAIIAWIYNFFAAERR